MMEPKISIIIPCYNIENHIEKCVNSVLNQTDADFELLLLNDGSTDQTLDILQKLEKNDARIKIFSHANRGVSYTRNRGIELTNSDYIMFIDGDDYVKPDFLEKHLQYASNNVWPISGMINVNIAEEKENIFRELLNNTQQRVFKEADFFTLFKYHCLSSPCCRVYSSEILKKNKVAFNLEVSYQEDLLFNLTYLKYVKEVYVIDYFGYFYVKHASSSTVQYHKNFNHIDSLLSKVLLLLKSTEDANYIKQFTFDMVMKGLSNELHKNSPLSFKSKIINMKRTINSYSYNYCFNYINKTNTSFLTKKILQSKNVFLIFSYFTLIGYVK